MTEQEITEAERCNSSVLMLGSRPRGTERCFELFFAECVAQKLLRPCWSWWKEARPVAHVVPFGFVFSDIALCLLHGASLVVSVPRARLACACTCRL